MIQMPLFEPESDWECPKRLPVFPSGADLGVDSETKDGGLQKKMGPGWVFRDGYILGVSVAWNDEKYYFPLRHLEGGNMDIGEVMAWLQDAMNRARRIIFHNAPYDIGWLSVYDVEVDFEKIEDTQAMGVLVDENRFEYNLDACCEWQGLPGKNEALLREFAATYGIKPKDVKAEMWKLPAKAVGPYAEDDAAQTLKLYHKFRPQLEEQNLIPAYRLEMDLVPMGLAMRRRGIRIDEDAAERTMLTLDRIRDKKLAGLKDRLGHTLIDMEFINSPTKLARVFDELKIEYPRTPKTNVGSFSSDWMADHPHWLPQEIVAIRKTHDMSNKFIGNYLLGSTVVGRVHAEIHFLRDDDGGTRSYRLSYSNPPLQQMPARDPYLAPMVRGIILPERGEFWTAGDYSQQEPRMAVHFAVICKLAGSEAARSYYADNPNADFHTMVSELTGIPRKAAKIINLGLMYGMGLDKLAFSLGISKEEAANIVEQYNERMPFVAALAEFCDKRAKNKGFIRLLDGARCRFDSFEPAWREKDEPWSPPVHGEAAARAKWGATRRLRRSFTHKGMNRLVQGSAARQTKMAMRECFRQGLLPVLQMHDELDFSFADQEQVDQAEAIMRDIVQLSVPMKVDMQCGYTWGQASEEPPKGTEPPTIAELRAHGPKATNTEIYKAREAA